MDRISVIITSYNQKDLLREAITSVLDQTLPAHEILVCDDASTDGSQALIGEFEKAHPGLVRGILHKENQGVARNRNSGLQAVHGDFVTWLDGDDVFLPRKLELESGYCRVDPDVRWVYSQVMTVRPDGRRKVRHKCPLVGNIFFDLPLVLGAAPRNLLVEADALRAVGFFDEEMTLYEDFDLCIRLAERYECAYCPKPNMEYRVHPGGVHRSAVARHNENFSRLHRNFLRLIAKRHPDEQRMLEARLQRSWDLRRAQALRGQRRFAAAVMAGARALNQVVRERLAARRLRLQGFRVPAEGLELGVGSRP
jgi:glycosyltransferase involved in cell wall biosynthesis